MIKGIYVASRVRHAEMWRKARDAGAPIISSWIDEAGEGETEDLGELWDRIIREISSAKRLVFYVEKDDFPLKGALVEVGIALSHNVPVYVVLKPDVRIEPRSFRPLGSWCNHPLVRLESDLNAALEIGEGKVTT